MACGGQWRQFGEENARCMVAQVDAIGMWNANGAAASMWLHKYFLLGVNVVKSAIEY